MTQPHNGDAARRDSRRAGETRRPSAPTHADDEDITRPIQIVGMNAPRRGVLVEASGEQAGRPHAIAGDIATIGRGNTCHIQIDDEGLSRVHASIVRRRHEYMLVDSGSTNGTYVNERRVSEVVLDDGDRVRMGATVSMRFQLLSEDEGLALARLYESSVRDGLTGVFNRRHLDERLTAELAFAVRHGTDLSVVILDLDHFKRVNDGHGHLAGDEVLRRTARSIASVVRTEDLVARYGGEEFLLVLRGVGLAGAKQLAERLRALIESAPIPFGEQTIRVTASLGVASLACCRGGRNIHQLVGCADERLYRAKASGRNRVAST